MNSQKAVLLPDRKDIIAELQAEQERKERLLFLAIAGVVVFLTPLVVLAGINLGLGLIAAVVAVIVLTSIIAHWPQSGFFVILGCVVFIDQSPLLAPVVTDRLYVYYWPAALQGLPERPIGFLFLFILFVLICRRAVKREWLLRGGALLVPLLLFSLCLVGGAIHGYTTGGDVKIMVVELRPFVYLFESYLIAYNLVTRKSDVYAFFWFVIAGAGVKALQGIYIYIKLHGQLGDGTLMSHEESYFFCGLLLLVILLSLHHRYRPQLIAALAVLPVIVVTLVLNNRRADYIALVFGLGSAWVLMFVITQRARKMLVIIALLSILFGGGYIVAFANSTSGIGLPAHAIVAVFNPSSTDTRNADSNQYRITEDYDLKYTIDHNNFLFGLGFGKPYLQPVPLATLFPTIASSDIYYNYVPHNNIYWVWMRLGMVGFLIFWYLIGAIIVRASLIARQMRDRYLQMMAIYIVGMTLMEILVAYADYQLFAYRNVIYIGLLAGILMKLPELDKNEAAMHAEDEDGRLMQSAGYRREKAKVLAKRAAVL